ncbi:hypothetical protein GCM10009799_02250 [Nocardiopsis rhodophaea]|uniref:Uncharacterized protein n=1 Tax=Nocardiopsis rhodophaea TaxID=280238 RepID=A0ABN2S5Q2_9ACTN
MFLQILTALNNGLLGTWNTSGELRTPVVGGDHEHSFDLVRGLGDMYVDDPRLAATRRGTRDAAFVRDSLHDHDRISI